MNAKRLLTAFLVVAFLSFYGCAKDDGSKKDRYEIFAEYHDNGLIAVDLTVNYYLRFKNQSFAVFNLFPQGYTEKSNGAMLDSDDKEGVFEIIKVEVFSSPADYSFYRGDVNALSVNFDDYKGKDFVEIKIKYYITLPKGDKRLSVTTKTVNLGGFIILSAPYKDGEFQIFKPTKIGDPFISELSDFTVKIVLPSVYALAGSANVGSLDVAGDKTMYTYSLSDVRDFVLVLSKNYSVDLQKWGNRSIYYCFYDDDTPVKTMELVKNCLNFYEKSFGEYPYATFTICQTELSESGMEYPCLAMVSDELTKEDYYYVIAHEIAHQWWYGIVGVDQTVDYAVDEGLSEYSAYLYFDYYKGWGISAESLYEKAKFNLKTYLADTSYSSYEEFLKNFLTNKPLSEYKTAREYIVNAYAMPFCLFKERSESVGREDFTKSLASFFESYKFKKATVSDLKKSLF